MPITLQTLAVTLAGALLGARRGALAVLLWLTLAALGLPLLAEGKGGLEPFTGPTVGYLLAFPVAAAAVGVLVQRGWNGRHPARLFLAMLIGNGICLALGGAWLAAAVGVPAALDTGVLPFLPGAAVKSIAGAVIVAALAGQRPTAPAA